MHKGVAGFKRFIKTSLVASQDDRVSVRESSQNVSSVVNGSWLSPLPELYHQPSDGGDPKELGKPGTIRCDDH